MTTIKLNPHPKYADTKDEWYGSIWKCPYCGDVSIWRYFHYCPECGAQLTWEEEAQ